MVNHHVLDVLKGTKSFNELEEVEIKTISAHMLEGMKVSFEQ